MADWTFADSSRFAVGGTVAIVGGGTVTAHASTNTKGAWQQLVSRVPFDTDIITLESFSSEVLAGDSVKNVLMDIGRGTPGAEQVIVSDLSIAANNESVGCHYRLPQVVNAGDALSARSQSNVSGRVVSAGFRFETHGFAHSPPAGRIKTYGADTSTSRTTSLTPGAANVKGAWAQITASTSEDIQEIIIVASQESDSGLDNSWYIADVGLGSAGNERIIIPDITITTYSSNSGIHPNLIGPIPYSIPARSRIAMRVQTDSSGVGRNIGFVIIGISR